MVTVKYYSEEFVRKTEEIRCGCPVVRVLAEYWHIDLWGGFVLGWGFVFFGGVESRGKRI